MARYSAALIAALVFFAGCGTSEQEVGSTDPTDVGETSVEISVANGVLPVGGQTVGAGHVVLYGAFGRASDGSGDLWRSTEVVALDLETGDQRRIETPTDFWIAQAVATPSGLVAVGGPCSREDIVPVEEVDDVSCPDRVTMSYRMDWESGHWDQLTLESDPWENGAFPYVEGGNLIANGNTVFLVLRTTVDESLVLVNTGDSRWSPVGGIQAVARPSCATDHGLVTHERFIDPQRPDQVSDQRLNVISVDGSMRDIPLPDGVPNDSFGGISTSVGCLRNGPVLLFGGAEPSENAPVTVVALLDGIWSEVRTDFSTDSAGGLPSRVSSNDGAVTFYVASLTNDGKLRRGAYALEDVQQGVDFLGDVATSDEALLEAEPQYLYDSTTGSIVGISVNLDATTITWS